MEYLQKHHESMDYDMLSRQLLGKSCENGLVQKEFQLKEEQGSNGVTLSISTYPLVALELADLKSAEMESPQIFDSVGSCFNPLFGVSLQLCCSCSAVSILYQKILVMAPLEEVNIKQPAFVGPAKSLYVTQAPFRCKTTKKAPSDLIIVQSLDGEVVYLMQKRFSLEGLKNLSELNSLSAEKARLAMQSLKSHGSGGEAPGQHQQLPSSCLRKAQANEDHFTEGGPRGNLHVNFMLDRGDESNREEQLTVNSIIQSSSSYHPSSISSSSNANQDDDANNFKKVVLPLPPPWLPVSQWISNAPQNR
ncbi:hypothetical protein GH714_018855 [Hevea brasiliensis]|uniref:Uncharacterized protein n=1 Tax=Hevea brasiliensis TaxID=3981 RepID=A0A6A6MB79_HEVBR|nr:hypothetical protein GH714_018855 [Hevea brasiliensis]